MLRWLAEFERTQHLGPDEMAALQLERLRGLLDRAYRRCPFYRERFDAIGIAPGDVRTPEDLASLPVLEKRHIQEHQPRMVAEGWPGDDLMRNQTGGSTGTPISYLYSKERHRSRLAATIRHNRWAGWDIGDKVAYVWGAPRDRPSGAWRARVYSTLTERSIYLDTAEITEEKLAGFHAELKRFRPRTISAYARSLHLLARYIKDRGWTAYQPHSIVTSAEVLEDDERALIQQVFGCPVFNRYGCREFSVVASECPAHLGLHTMAEGLLVEVVRDNDGIPDGMGSILVTDLLNEAMPMIRYRIGDFGAWADGPCPCGRALPRLRTVAGRITDFLVGDDGRLVSGVFLATYVVAKRPSLGQVQIRQSATGEVQFLVKPGLQFSDPEDRDYLVRASKEFLGAGATIAVSLVDDLAREPSGKYLFSRSDAVPKVFVGGATIVN
jgi:phenylacetate-CoA ligase